LGVDERDRETAKEKGGGVGDVEEGKRDPKGLFHVLLPGGGKSTG